MTHPPKAQTNHPRKRIAVLEQRIAQLKHDYPNGTCWMGIALCYDLLAQEDDTLTMATIGGQKE